MYVVHYSAEPKPSGLFFRREMAVPARDDIERVWTDCDEFQRVSKRYATFTMFDAYLYNLGGEGSCLQRGIGVCGMLRTITQKAAQDWFEGVVQLNETLRVCGLDVAFDGLRQDALWEFPYEHAQGTGKRRRRGRGKRTRTRRGQGKRKRKWSGGA